jgi:transposase
MKAYSLDLRTRIVQAVEDGMTKSKVARTFSISLATVKNDVRQHEATGSLAARPIPGRPRAIPPEQEAALVAHLRARPDTTLAELREDWKREQGASVSITTLSRAIRRLRWTRKKRRWMPPNVIPMHVPRG